MRFLIATALRGAAFVAAIWTPLFVQADTKSWSGGADNNNWTAPLNWVGGVAPSPNDLLLFDTFARLTPNNNFPAATQFNGISFGPAAGPFTLSGNSITLGGNLADNTPLLTESINLPLILAVTPDVAVGNDAFLSLTGVVSGGFGLTKTGNGTLTLGAANTFTGPVTIAGGTLRASADNNLGAAPAAPTAGRLVINSGAALQSTANFTINANRGVAIGPTTSIGSGIVDVTSGTTLTYGGVIANNGAGTGGLTRIRFGGLTLSGANTYTGPTAVMNGTLTLNFADAAATTPLNNIIAPSSTLSLGGATAGLGQNNNATLAMTGKAAVNNVQTFAGTNIDIYGSVINVTNGAGGTATLNLGALSHSLGGTVVIPTTSGTVNTTTTVATTNGILGGWAVAGTPDVQRGITLGNAFATVDATGKIVPYTAHVTAPEYVPGNNATLLRNDPGIVANADKNLKFVGDATARLLRVDLENAGTTTDINTFAFTTGGINNTLVIGTGNTLRLGKYGGIYKQANGNNQMYIGGSTDTPQTGNGTASSATPSQVGFLTAGGPVTGTTGEIVLTLNDTANNNGGLNIEASIVDNGPGGTVTLIKTGVMSVKIDGHNSYSGGTFINQGRFQLAGSEVGRMVNPAGGNDLTVGNPDGLGTGRVTVAPGGYLFVSGVNGTGLFTGNGAIPGALPNTAQNAPIPNNMTLSGNGTSQEGIGAIRLGGKAILSGQITLGGDARIGGSSNNGNTDVAYDTFPAINPDGTTLYVDPGHLLSGKITGPFGLDIGSNVSISTNFKISNPTNDWSGDTTFVTGGGTTRLRLGANEVIPHGPGKGNLVWGPLVGTNVARLDLNGFNETINGLSTTTTNLSSVIIENTGFTPTVVPDPANPGQKTYSYGAGTSTLTVGGFDQTATFGGVIRDTDTARTVTLPDPNSVTVPPATITVTAPWATGAKMALTKIGTGIQTLSGANTYTGLTAINGGTLSVTGSLAVGGNVAVNAGGTLSGAGDGTTTGVVGNVTMAASGSIAPGATSALGSVGTLTPSSLTVNGGDLKFNLVSPAASDRINVNGPVNFTAASTITPNGGVAGIYTVLASTAGPITYGATPTVTPFVDPLSRPATYELDTTSDPSAIKLKVTGGAKTLTWTGATNGNWDINTTTNWTDGAIAEKFFNSDIVSFGDVAATRNVDITTVVRPGGLTVNNTGANTYTFTGSGGIGGSTGLTKSGNGTLILATANSYSGSTDITAGTLQVGDGGTAGSLGTGPVANEGVLIFNRSDASSAPNVISGAGEMRKIGTGTVTLGGASTYTGPTNIVAGTISVANSQALGAILGSPVTISSGAALDLAGATAADSLNFSDGLGAKQFIIAGSGVGGTGAITNSGTVNQLNALQSVTLAADATVGGTGRFDMRQNNPVLNLAAHTLTKTGPNQFTLVGTSVTDGNIVVNEGVFAMETTTSLSNAFSEVGTITYNAGSTAQFFNLSGDVTRQMIINGAVTMGNAGNAAQPSTVGSNIRLKGDLTITNLNNSAGALTLNGVISEMDASHSITKNGPTSLTLNGANTYTGTTTINDGTIRVTGAINSNNAVSVAAPATFAVEGTASSVGAISGAGVTTVGNGVTPTNLSASSVRQSSLTIAADSQVTTRAGGATSVLGTLSIAGTPAAPTAKLDLTNSALVLDYPAAGPNPAADTRQQIIAGRGGTGLGKPWNGKGITSSTAQADVAASPNSRSIGYAVNADLPLGALTTFRGQAVDPSSVLIRYTRTADANLDGVVNDDDVTVVGTFYAPGVSKPEWAKGDFDFNGFVDDDDVTLLGVFYNPAATPIPAPAAGDATAAAGGGAVAAVPEPASLVLFGVMALALGAVAAVRRRVKR